MKPILIDAIYINMGGAFMILNHLINNLVKKNVNFVLLKDIRCKKLEEEENIQKLIILQNTEVERRKYYKAHINSFRSVLCLGNVPPSIKLNFPVYTYIHNVNLLKIPKHYPLKWKVKNWLKRFYINIYSKNTTHWIVQTQNTDNLVHEYLNCKHKQIFQFPFYNIPHNINSIPLIERRDYVFIGEYTFAKGHEALIEAWIKLSEIGFKGKLHMTVNYEPIKRKIAEAVKKGANIENHGRIPFNEVIKLYNLSKAIVYPSLNESLGLGIIEAIEAGCDVIGCDLPYLYSVCKPSIVFKPDNSDSIVAAILKYEDGTYNPTQGIISDMVNDLIELLRNA